MTKRIVMIAGFCAALTVSAGIVEETNSRPELAGALTIAPFREITTKVSSLGTLIGNQTVATLMLTAGQQQVADKLGRFRSDSPFMFLFYIQTPAWDIAATNTNEVAIEDLCAPVLVYPSSDGPATLVLNHPGATNQADGTVHLLPSERIPFETYVKYSKDGRFCAYAMSPELAALGLADFAKLNAARTGKMYPLVRFELFERGLSAIAQFESAAMEYVQEATEASKGDSDTGTLELLRSLNGNQKADLREFFQELRQMMSYALVLDYDSTGLKVESVTRRKPGCPQYACVPLPVGALDHAPNNAFLSVFYNLVYVYGDETKFRAKMKDVAVIVDQLTAQVRSQFAKEEEGKKYVGFVTDVGKSLAQACRTAIYPSKDDWQGMSFACDQEQHPYFKTFSRLRQMNEAKVYADSLSDSIVTVFEKQWPGKGILVKVPGGVSFDWHAMIDQIGREAGVQPGDKDDKELQVAKQKIVQVLGSAKTTGTTSWGKEIADSYLGSPNLDVLSRTETIRTGEARMIAAIPEMKNKRPVLVGYLAPYAFVRESVLAIAAKVAAPSVGKQYQQLQKTLPPAEKNSAWAFAAWSDPQGSRGIFRITANELKNYGAAFNAYMLSSMTDDGSDDKE